MKPAIGLFSLGVALLLPLAVNATMVSAWPTWRGGSGAGIAPGAQPPTEWSEQLNIKWKTKVAGLGFSSPIVWQDRIFLLSAIETAASAAPVPAPVPAAAPEGDRRGRRGGGSGGGTGPTAVHEFVVIALDRKTGRTLWQRTARSEVPHEGHHATNSFASGSPVTDGQRLYVPFGSRGFYCYDFDGNLVWEKDLGDMQTRGSFGEGASPALAGDVLILPWDHEGNSFIVGLDKSTGAEIWRHDREERSSWTTPLVVEVDGRLQAIVPGTNRTRSYDTKTGEVIWEAAGLTDNVIPTPVTGHGRVYVMSGYRGNSIQAIKLSSRGDVSDTDNIVWNVRKSAPYVSSPVLSGDRLYMHKSNDAFLSCVDAHTGEVHYQDQRLEGLRGIYASPVAANGFLYLVGREGTVMVIKDSAQFEIVSTNKLDDRIDASPAILEQEMFLRGHNYLYCIAEG